MGWQREIAQTILSRQADYVLALKGNQSSLREDVELFATNQTQRDYADTWVTQDQYVDADHGRIETRTTTVFHDIDWLQKCHAWPGLKTILMVESSCELNGVH